MEICKLQFEARDGMKASTCIAWTAIVHLPQGFAEPPLKM